MEPDPQGKNAHPPYQGNTFTPTQTTLPALEIPGSLIGS